jgi:hypothetical protein
VLEGLSADAAPAFTRLPPELCVRPDVPSGGGLVGANLARANARATAPC